MTPPPPDKDKPGADPCITGSVANNWNDSYSKEPVTDELEVLKATVSNMTQVNKELSEKVEYLMTRDDKARSRNDGFEAMDMDFGSDYDIDDTKNKGVREILDRINQVQDGFGEWTIESEEKAQETRDDLEKLKRKFEIMDETINIYKNKNRILTQDKDELAKQLRENQEYMEMVHTKVIKIDETMDKFLLQQSEIIEAHLKKSDRERDARVNLMRIEMIELKNTAESAVRKAKALNQSHTETKQVAKVARDESRIAMSRVSQAPTGNPWKVVQPRKKVTIRQIMNEERRKELENPNTHHVYVKVTDNEKRYDLDEIGQKVANSKGEEAIKSVGRTFRGNIRITLTDGEAAKQAEKWIREIDPSFDILNTDQWFKGVIYGIRNDIDVAKLRESIEKRNGIKLASNPRIMKETEYGSTVLLSFEDDNQYMECISRGICIGYQSYRMTRYRRSSDRNRNFNFRPRFGIPWNGPVNEIQKADTNGLETSIHATPDSDMNMDDSTTPNNANNDY